MDKPEKTNTAEPQIKTLVFLHYFGGSAQSWQWVVDELKQEYHCVSINLPGFGKTNPLDNPSIQAFAHFVQHELQRLHITECILVGHSMGGKIALQVAAEDETGTVKELILIAPSPPTTEPMPPQEKERMLRHPVRAEAEQSLKNGAHLHLPEERFKMAVETQLLVDPATWRWWLEVGMDHSIAEKVAALKLPITVLASQDDPVITSRVMQERVMPFLPQAILISTLHLGHLLPLESPSWVAAQIRKIA